MVVEPLEPIDIHDLTLLLHGHEHHLSGQLRKLLEKRAEGEMTGEYYFSLTLSRPQNSCKMLVSGPLVARLTSTKATKAITRVGTITCMP